ncbi:MAG TPA: XRE family transcriptional regulator [Tepidisphaeraceae bacterium]|nr:XRE family transcriptional regulator [Tepidisphaeraceae bacterium]
MEEALRTVKVRGERLAAVWRGSLMSQESFARAIGMKRSGIFRLMRPGVHGMFTDNFRRMAEVLGTTPEDLGRRLGPNGCVRALDSDLACGVSGAAQPLDDLMKFHSVSAGVRSERLDVQVGTVKVPPGLADFCVRVDGDSMLPEYPNNSIALFESVKGQEFIYGKDFLIWFDNNECYFSRVLRDEDDRDVLILRKVNPDRRQFPDRKVHYREIMKIARCVGVLMQKK